MRLLILLLTLLPAVATSADLIGSTVPPYPPGLVHRQGSCITPERGPEHVCDYSIGLLEDPAGNPQLLYGARTAGRVEKKALWTVTDAIPYPAVPSGYSFAIGTCRVNGKNDSTILAVVRSTDEEWLRDLSWAKRFDLATGKLVEQATAGLECANEGWGL